MIPCVLVAGTKSGVGKTTVVLGLLAALRRRGFEVAPFKVGPDFIDPTHHTAICERASRNLDTFMMGEEGVRRSFAKGVEGADVAVIEGVMGLYDGLDATEVASSAAVAKALGAPVLLVINVHGTSRSAAAMALGYAKFDPEVEIAGLILNRVGSERHLTLLQEALKPLGIPILAALPRKSEISLKSRHLGLTMGFEGHHDLDALADFVEENADLDWILKLGCNVPPSEPLPEFGGDRIKIGVAYDEAFCFYYQENFDELRRLGAEIEFFSPMCDPLPDVQGLYLGGGYPELYAEALERSQTRSEIKKAAENGMPIYGECGGLMYLCESVVSKDGDSENKMAGILPASTTMTGRLQALGYVEGDVVGENSVVERGRVIRGHEFHYSKMDCEKWSSRRLQLISADHASPQSDERPLRYLGQI
ncbi:MAG: putative cobyrinic acid A,C-diamide synthase [Methanothrix harundinacea]|uniref:Cobyrinate a,c-diamide synthase n=1 Tax=Methanothrix harundinacea TaxID=301375 RepID=A0A124FMH2_9EURY|nr:MAG: putative cobyrinic acid A,C-diamide synthase [Methanothrix harundinacea]